MLAKSVSMILQNAERLHNKNMADYKARIVDAILQKRLESKGAVLIEGPKWCGKTTTALQQAGSVLRVDNPESKEQNLQLAKLGGDTLIGEGAKNLLRLQKKLDTTRMKEPSFLMVLTGVGQYPYQREDGVLVVPIGCMGS